MLQPVEGVRKGQIARAEAAAGKPEKTDTPKTVTTARRGYGTLNPKQRVAEQQLAFRLGRLPRQTSGSGNWCLVRAAAEATTGCADLPDEMTAIGFYALRHAAARAVQLRKEGTLANPPPDTDVGDEDFIARRELANTEAADYMGEIGTEPSKVLLNDNKEQQNSSGTTTGTRTWKLEGRFLEVDFLSILATAFGVPGFLVVGHMQSPTADQPDKLDIYMRTYAAVGTTPTTEDIGCMPLLLHSPIHFDATYPAPWYRHKTSVTRRLPTKTEVVERWQAAEKISLQRVRDKRADINARDSGPGRMDRAAHAADAMAAAATKMQEALRNAATNLTAIDTASIAAALDTMREGMATVGHVTQDARREGGRGMKRADRQAAAEKDMTTKEGRAASDRAGGTNTGTTPAKPAPTGGGATAGTGTATPKPADSHTTTTAPAPTSGSAAAAPTPAGGLAPTSAPPSAAPITVTDTPPPEDRAPTSTRDTAPIELENTPPQEDSEVAYVAAADTIAGAATAADTPPAEPITLSGTQPAASDDAGTRAGTPVTSGDQPPTGDSSTAAPTTADSGTPLAAGRWVGGTGRLSKKGTSSAPPPAPTVPDLNTTPPAPAQGGGGGGGRAAAARTVSGSTKKNPGGGHEQHRTDDGAAGSATADTTAGHKGSRLARSASATPTGTGASARASPKGGELARTQSATAAVAGASTGTNATTRPGATTRSLSATSKAAATAATAGDPPPRPRAAAARTH